MVGLRKEIVMLGVSIAALCEVGGASAAPPQTGFLLKTIDYRGTQTRYVVFLPPDYTPNRKWPTIIFLNGYGECGTDGYKQISVGLGPAIMTNVKEWPFLVLFPQKPKHEDSWEQYDDMVMAILNKTKCEYSVDENRVYLTGLSQGGFGTWAIAAKHPDVFAAIAPICGGGRPDEMAPALKNLPIWSFHGDADPVVKVELSKAMVDAVNAAGGNAKLTIYPGVGHNSWDKAYREEKLGEWFLQHTRKAK